MIENKDKFKVAYFSMEIALENDIKTYAGGLGILAGDLLKSAAEIKFPMVGITLLSRQGYFKQILKEDGRQITEADNDYNFSKLKKLSTKVSVKIGKEDVQIAIWEYLISGNNNFSIPVYLLDTNLEKNKPEFRNLTDNLYGRDKAYRLQQEIILGRGGIKALKALNYQGLKKFHLNEGHGSLAAIELFLDSQQTSIQEKINEVRRKTVFTTHTPLQKEQDIFSLEYLMKYQPDFPNYLSDLIIKKRVNLTIIGLYFSNYTNAVSKLHQKVTQKMFPKYPISSITNGVNSSNWTSLAFKKLYDKYIPNWSTNPSFLEQANKIPRNEIWKAHQGEKEKLVKYINDNYSDAKFNKDDFILSFARRFTAYKRPDFLFNNIKKLLKVQKQGGKLQIIYAGKAHPNDLGGQELIKKIYQFKKDLNSEITIIFLENYDIKLAKILVSGSDLWLNTPLIPNEASGTSGMKAAHNGIPQLSTLDGWWSEACQKNKNAWVIKEKKTFIKGKMRSNLYPVLKKILLIYYNNPRRWQEFMRLAISLNASYFNTNRALKEYIKEAYKL